MIITIVSGFWFFSIFLEGIPAMARDYFHGDGESVIVLTFLALGGLMTLKVFGEKLEKERSEKEIQEISKKYFDKKL